MRHILNSLWFAVSFCAMHAFGLLLILALVTWLTGCDDSRKQAAADAIAGAEALRPEADAAGLGCVVDGIQSYTVAAVGVPRIDLPRSQSAPAYIRDNPRKYYEGGRRAEDSIGAFGWAAIGTTIVAAVVLALRTTGIGGPVGALLAGVLENAVLKQRKADRAAEHEAGQTVIRTIATLPETATIEALKKALKPKMPDRQRSAVRRVRSQSES